MAYEISGYVDATNAPTDAATQFDEWVQSYTTVTDTSQYRKIDARKDGTLQAYHEFSAHLAFTEDIDAALTDLIETRFSSVEWFVVHTRHSTIEESDYVDDETYYSPTMDTGLRSTPSFDIESPHVRSHDAIHYRVDGTNYTIPAGEIDFSDIDISTPVELYATTEEELVVDGNGVRVGEVSANTTIEGTDVAYIEPDTFSLIETDTSVQFTRGSPPSYFANPDESFPERVDPDYFARNYVTEESLSAIKTQIDSINSDNQDVQEALNTIAYILTGDNRYK